MNDIILMLIIEGKMVIHLRRYWRSRTYLKKPWALWVLCLRPPEMHRVYMGILKLKSGFKI
jgi:hypothetical protein